MFSLKAGFYRQKTSGQVYPGAAYVSGSVPQIYEPPERAGERDILPEEAPGLELLKQHYTIWCRLTALMSIMP